MKKLLTSHRKYAVALLAALTTVANVSLVHGTALQYVQVGIAVLAAEGVRLAGNQSAAPTGD